MTKILLIEKELKPKGLLTGAFQRELKATVINCNDTSDAFDALKSDKTIELVVSRAVIDEKDTAIHLLSFLKANNFEIGVIILGEFEVVGVNYEFVNMNKKSVNQIIDEAKKLLPSIEEEIVEEVEKVAKKEEKEEPPEDPPETLKEYYPISLQKVMDARIAPCDIYLKVTRSGNDKYIKRINSDDEIDKGGVSSYVGKIDFMYVKSIDRKKF